MPRQVLTERQIIILRLLLAGEANKRIASLLGLCVRTIEADRQIIMTRARVRSAVQLGAWAQMHQFTPLSASRLKDMLRRLGGTIDGGPTVAQQQNAGKAAATKR